MYQGGAGGRILPRPTCLAEGIRIPLLNEFMGTEPWSGRRRPSDPGSIGRPSVRHETSDVAQFACPPVTESAGFGIRVSPW